MRYGNSIPAWPILNVSQPKTSYAAAYNKTLEEIEGLVLSGDKLARRSGLITLLDSEDPFEKISSRNLIVVCVSLVSLTVEEDAEFLGIVATRREFRFNFALFERKSGLFWNVLCGSVKVTSDQKAQAIWDIVCSDIKSHPVCRGGAGYRIRVYQVWLYFAFGLWLTCRSPKKHLPLRTIRQSEICAKLRNRTLNLAR